MTLLLDRSTVNSLLDLDFAREQAKDAFLSLEENQVTMLPRVATPIASFDATHLTMPCYVRRPDRPHLLCTKIAAVYPNNPTLGLPTTTAFLCLQDAETGALLSLMDAESITATRTAAASAMAAEVLSSSDARTLGIVGAGVQARAHLAALLRVRPLQEVRISARTQCPLDSFQSLVPDGVKLKWEERAEMAVRGADIVCATTNSAKPVIHDEWVAPHALVVAVGSFRPDMAELDIPLVQRSTVVVDQIEAAQNGAGELIAAAREGALDWAHVRTLGQVLRDQPPLRTDRPIIYKSVGLAVQDAYLADWVYRRALAEQAGQPFNLDN
ncbi:MAG: ornithine cyclodeaminase family protein [Fimbriimonadaceae bacterium]